MNAYPRSHRSGRSESPAGSDAFTLVEVLVSMAVLVVMVVWITQLTSSTGSTITESEKYIDADSQARLIFSRMAVDFANMLQRTDVDYTTFKHRSYTVSANAPVAAGTTVADNLQQGPAGGGNDQFAFYSKGPGYYSNTNNTGFAGSARAPVSLVAYNVQADVNRGNTMNLQRMSKALGWDSNANSWQNVAYLPLLLTTQWTNPRIFVADPTQPTGIDPNYAVVGEQVFRLEYNYLLKPNPATGAQPIDPDTNLPVTLTVTPWDRSMPTHNLTTSGLNDVAAIVVAIAVLDPRSRVIVSPTSLASMSAALPDAATPTTGNPNPDILTDWTNVINGTNGYPDFATKASVPRSAAGAVRVYQRYFYLDGH